MRVDAWAISFATPTSGAEDEAQDRETYQYDLCQIVARLPPHGGRLSLYERCHILERSLSVTTQLSRSDFSFVGLGSFSPCGWSAAEDHKMEAEPYEISQAAAAA